MESRALIAVVLSILVLVGFQYFLGPKHPPTSSNVTETQESPSEATPPDQAPNEAATPPGTQPLASGSPLLANATPGRQAKDITVESPLYRITFSEAGGGIKGFELKQYRSTIAKDSPPVNLVNTQRPELPLTIGLGEGPGSSTGSIIFEADKDALTLTGTETQPSHLTLTARLAGGGAITEVYTFHPDSYLIDLSISADGLPGQSKTIYLYDHTGKSQNRYIFEGPSYYAQGSLKEVKLSNAGDRETYKGALDWIGYGDNYFLSALVPQNVEGPWDASMEKKEGDLIEIRLTGDAHGKGALRLGAYFGPKEIDRLKALDHNLSKAINFGWFDPIAKPVLYFLKFLYRYVHNYGVAIILITLLIKIAFWPLAQKSAKSMKTMQKLQPKLAKLKEKHGDDKERLNRELLQLYKTYKVNPMSGCLPMLLQIPVFFALYKVLLQAIELRHAPFMFWINDLSAPDRLMIPGVVLPYLGGIPVLTLFMGVSMFFQQKMTPSALDPTQAKMMQFLPVVFTFLFINFPSGLVLYWLVNNLASIGQQYYINKFST